MLLIVLSGCAGAATPPPSVTNPALPAGPGKSATTASTSASAPPKIAVASPGSGWTPMRRSGPPIVLEVSAGSDITCARTIPRAESPPDQASPAAGAPNGPAATTVWCWGSNVSDPPGPPGGLIQTKPWPIAGLGDITQISTGARVACALDRGGSAWCWDYYSPVAKDRLGLAPVPVKLPQVAQIAAGGHTCMLLRDTTVHCWGSNDYGQIGDGTKKEEARREPFLVLKGAAQVASGLGHTCALMLDGSVQCWGKSTHGELGAGSREWRTRPAPVPGLRGVVELASTGEHTCARMKDGTVRCWGANWSGQVGDGTKADRPSPMPVRGVTQAIQIAAGDEHSCALVRGGDLFCWGSNYAGAVGNGSNVHQALPVRVLGGVAQVTAGHMHSCAVLTNGSASCWGSNRSGQLGDGTTTARSVPAPVSW
jgi:alpha-tubulin suppressor-like RCC1 family protein